MEAYRSSAELVVALLAAAVVVGAIAGKLRVPYAVALLLVTLPLRTPAASVFAPSLLTVLLPTLIFEAAWHLDLAHLRRYWRPIAFLAVPGVAITAFSVAVALWLVHALPFTQALLLGAIVSATDPIAVTAAFKELSAPEELSTIVEGESLCNDGIAVVLYSAVVAVLAVQHPDTTTIVLHAAGGSVAGIVIGLAAAAIVAFGMRTVRDAPLQICASLVAAFAAYLAADRFGASGIFAALVVGVALRAFPGFPADEETTLEIDRFWGALAFIANSLVFLLLGLRIEFGRIFHEPLLALVAIAAVLVSRAVLAYGALPLLGITQRGWRGIVFLSGMRGALSLALALTIPTSVPYRAEVIDAVFAVVAFTLVVQGLSIGPVLRRFRL